MEPRSYVDKRGCIVGGCSFKRADNVSLHAFPFSRPEIFAKWEAFVFKTRKPLKLAKASRICSAHFTTDNFITNYKMVEKITGQPTTSRIHLIKDAVPTILPRKQTVPGTDTVTPIDISPCNSTSVSNVSEQQWNIRHASSQSQVRAILTNESISKCVTSVESVNTVTPLVTPQRLAATKPEKRSIPEYCYQPAANLSNTCATSAMNSTVAIGNDFKSSLPPPTVQTLDAPDMQLYYETNRLDFPTSTSSRVTATSASCSDRNTPTDGVYPTACVSNVTTYSLEKSTPGARLVSQPGHDRAMLPSGQIPTVAVQVDDSVILRRKQSGMTQSSDLEAKPRNSDIITQILRTYLTSDVTSNQLEITPTTSSISACMTNTTPEVLPRLQVRPVTMFFVCSNI